MTDPRSPLLALPGTPLPATLSARRDGWRLSLLADRRALKAAVRAGTLGGRIGWLDVEVSSADLVGLAMERLRGVLGTALADDRSAPLRPPPLELAGIDLPPEYAVPSEVLARVPARLAYAHRVVPVALRDGALCLVADDPADEAVARELAAQLGQAVTLMACSRDPREHREIVGELLFRSYPGAGGGRASGGAAAVGDEEDVWGGRGAAVLDLIGALDPGPDELDSPIARLMGLHVLSCLGSGGAGFRLGVEADRVVNEHRVGGAWRVDDFAIPLTVGRGMLVGLAAACGIAPDVLPPVRTRCAVGDHQLDVELVLTGRGEQLTVEWRRAQVAD